MKKIRMIVALIACAMILSCTAMAAESLSASIEGKTLYVNWSADCSGNDCVLTVYRNKWPISVCYVNCADGGSAVPLGDPSGEFSVRLKTSNGCLTASVSGSEPAPTEVPVTATPAATATPEVTPTATPIATVAPTATAVPTDVPTTEPTIDPTATPEPTATAEPTIVPTAVPTTVPTVKPTIAPTAVPTAKPTTAPTSDPGSNQSSLASQVVEQVNAERAKYGYSQLRMDAELTRAAGVRAREIVETFSHTRPDGTQWSTVSSSAYGENIAKGQKTVDRVMASWMSSEGHRQNILRESYGSIGVCAYVNNGITYWVQLFGK